MINFLIAIFSIIFLAILHEFSHFIAAKKSGVFVEEFGIGYPPKIFGKKIGETIYSINLLPFGAFVKLAGELERLKDKRSFSAQPIFKRFLIAFAGVLSFWIISAIIFSILFCFGNPVAISDEEDSLLISPKVQVAQVAPDSPAEKAGLKIGDTIKEFKIQNEKFKIEKVKELQELTQKYKGEKVILTVERGKEIFEIEIVPRVSPPKGEGPMGISLVRTTIKKYPIPLAFFQGTKKTFQETLAIIEGYFLAIENIFKKQPSGVELRGTIGILQLISQASQLGIVYFFNFLGSISIYLAIFNALPIPAVDGGKILFLTIEAIRKKPISQETEQKITAFCFGFLILVAILVTIKDIARILKL
jgi:regulator of sigma E protease